MQRDDIHGEEAPKAYRIFLGKVGGKNPFGEPMYRLVRAEDRTMKQGGLWKDWRPDATIQERGGIITSDEGLMTPSTLQPERTVLEVREVLKFPHLKGWLLERWCPRYFYGTKGAWQKLVVPGTDLPLLGPYPETGDYELAAGPTKELPAFSELKDAIERTENCKEGHFATVEEAVRDRVREAEELYEQQSAKERQEAEEKIKDVLIPLGRMSLEAGRNRQKLADAAGVREHAGN